MAPRDIPVGEDWTKAIRNAVGSSQAVVFLFSENANAAPHMEREIANAFYCGRTIIPLRLSDALPRRDFLFYLEDARWLEAGDPLAEQSLEALKKRIEDVSSSGGDHLPPFARKNEVPPRSANSWKTGLLAPSHRIPDTLKRIGLPASVVAIGVLVWLSAQQIKNLSAENNDSQSPQDRKASGNRNRGDSQTQTPHFVYTRFGLWQTEKSDPSATNQPDPETSSLSAAAPPSSNSLAFSGHTATGDQNSTGAVGVEPIIKPISETALSSVNHQEQHRKKLRTKKHSRQARN